MHQELMNQDVARLQRAEILRNSGKRHVVEASNDERDSVLHGIRVRDERDRGPAAPAAARAQASALAERSRSRR